MSGTISPTMIIAAAGFMNGSGLGVSSSMTSTLSSFNSSALTSSYTNLISALNSANIALPTMPSYFTGNVNNAQITSTISTTASQIAPDTKKFISNFSSASAFGSASFAWSAALAEASTKGFADFGGGITSFSDMASGGLSKIMSPAGLSLPGLPGAPGLSAGQLLAKPDFAALGSVFNNFGKAFDVSNVGKMFDPANFIKNLNKQGLGDVGGLSDKLQAMGIDPSKPESADPVQLRQVLATIGGSDLDKVISQTGLKIPTSGNPQSLDHLLDAAHIIPGDVISKLPGGNLGGLGNALTNMGGTFKSPADLANMLSSTQVPSLPNLDAMTKPIPDSVMAAFKPMLGAGGGPFGNPTVNDIIGTAAGHGHTDAFKTMVSAQASIMQSPAGQALKSAADALAADPSNSSKLSAFVSAQNAVTNSGNADLAKLISDSSAAITASTAQLAKEVSNLSVAGITPTSATTPQPTQLLGMASKLHEMGLDKQQLGYNEMLNNMAANDMYGDAIRATLMEGKNIAKASAAGIASTTKIDPMAVLAKTQAG